MKQITYLRSRAANRALAFAAMATVGLLSLGSTFAAVDADATAMVADQTSLFGDVKTYVYLVVGVSLAIGLLKWLRKGK